MKMWEVLHNYIGGVDCEDYYQVARIRDEAEPRHAGNFEWAGTFPTKKEAQAKADELNAHDRMQEVRQAVTSLGYADKSPVIAVELDEVRARVILDHSDLGIYDFSKHTFVD